MFFHVFRTLRAMAIGTTRDAVGPFDTCVTKLYSGFRMMDAFLHVNNSRYLELMEFARWEQGVRAGLGRRFKDGGCYPVVGTYHVQYLVPLMPFQFVDVHTKIVGMHAKGLVIEHRILTRGKKPTLVCTAMMKAVMMHKGKAIDGMQAMTLLGFSDDELRDAVQKHKMYFTDAGGELHPGAVEEAKRLGIELVSPAEEHAKLNTADDMWRVAINAERAALKEEAKKRAAAKKAESTK